ncbi:MAG: ABC transporter permease [Hyphomonadaceae bacterium]|nr:ABC transporter permease [Hyphomonadaceae bacterium]
MLLDFLLAGLVIGGIYALIAIGLNLQYGVARVLNLAYGEFLMLAGYAAFWGFTLLGLPPLLTLLVGAPVAFGLSWLLFRFVLHPLLARTADQGKREVDSILSTFGLLFVLQGVALVAWTGTDRTYSYLSIPVHIFGTVMVANRLIVLIAALALSAGVFAFLRYSTAGRAMRAIAASPHTAPLVGIDVKHYSALAFATGGALAAVAGILLSSFVGINPTIGAAFTVKALIVIVMGGIGHVMGGLIAALILGLAETLAALLLDPGLVTVINFVIFSIVLLWRPQGLFGGSARTGAPMRMPQHAPALAALAGLLLVPYVANTYWLSLAINILTYTALATGWAFFSGPTRYVSLAASAFFGIGAYAIAVLAPDYSYPVALLAAAGIALVLSAFVGLATLRLSGMYFVIFTFGLASLVSAAVMWWEFNIARKAGWHLFLSITTTHIYYQLLALCVAIIALWIVRDRSRMGFALKTLGADETVARQIGINTVALKIGTFVVSCVVMALAGAILAPRFSYMDATIAFNPATSFLTVIMALLGGATSVWGPMLGVIPLVLISDYLSVTLPHYFSVVLGLVLLGIVFLIPEGIIGLVRSGRAAMRTHTLADLLERLARRLRGTTPPPPASPPTAASRATTNGTGQAGHTPVPLAHSDAKARP